MNEQWRDSLKYVHSIKVSIIQCLIQLLVLLQVAVSDVIIKLTTLFNRRDRIFPKNITSLIYEKPKSLLDMKVLQSSNKNAIMHYRVYPTPLKLPLYSSVTL